MKKQINNMKPAQLKSAIRYKMGVGQTIAITPELSDAINKAVIQAQDALYFAGKTPTPKAVAGKAYKILNA